MEVEPSPPVIAKKLWNIAKIMFYMLRKGISKSKLLVDLHMMMLKQGKIASKTLGHLMLRHHYTALTCRSNEMSFVSPREYEFSCSNSPVYPSYYTKRKHHHHNHHHHHQHRTEDINVAQKVFDLLNNYEKAQASPLTLPGFGPSPLVRQLRITDSPFPLKDAEEDTQVDKAAEEFINRFYKELKKQKKAALESPSPYHMWGR